MFRQLMEVRRGRGVVDDWSWHAHNIVIAAVPAAILWVGLETIRRDMQAIDDALEESQQKSSSSSGGMKHGKHGKHQAEPHHGTQPAVEPQPNAVPQGAAAAPATDNAAIRELIQRLEMLEKLEKQRSEALSANRQSAPSAASSLIASGGVDSTNTSCSTAIVTPAAAESLVQQTAAESLVQQTAAGSLVQQIHHVALPPLSSTKIAQQNTSLSAGNDDSQPVAVSKGAGLSGNADSGKSTGYGIPIAILPVVGYMSYSLVVWANGKRA